MPVRISAATMELLEEYLMLQRDFAFGSSVDEVRAFAFKEPTMAGHASFALAIRDLVAFTSGSAQRFVLERKPSKNFLGGVRVHESVVLELKAFAKTKHKMVVWQALQVLAVLSLGMAIELPKFEAAEENGSGYVPEDFEDWRQELAIRSVEDSWQEINE